MKFSKGTAAVLLLLLAVIGSEIYYYNSRIESESREKKTLAVQKAAEYEQNMTAQREAEEKKIVETVDSYTKGYKEGCRKALGKSAEKSLKAAYERAYTLGFEKGESVCRAEAKRKKTLYERGKRCHDIEPLNCYLCACPHFRFDDSGFSQTAGKTLKSYCDIDAKEGKTIELTRLYCLLKELKQ